MDVIPRRSRSVPPPRLVNVESGPLRARSADRLRKTVRSTSATKSNAAATVRKGAVDMEPRKPSDRKKFGKQRSKSRRSRNRNSVDRSLLMHGVPVVTRKGEVKHPVALLNEVIVRRMPQIKFCTRVDCGPGGKRSVVTVCMVDEFMTEGRGSIRTSRRAAVEKMLDLLGYAPESGYSSENVRSTTSRSSQSFASGEPAQKLLKMLSEEPKSQSSVADAEAESTEEKPSEATVEEFRRSTEKRVRLVREGAGQRLFSKLLAIVREKFGPPVQYMVTKLDHLPGGNVYTVSCNVKHLITYGEGFGANGKSVAKAAAAAAMLALLKAYPPKGSDEMDFSAFNGVITEAIAKRPALPFDQVKSALASAKQVVKSLMRAMALRDPFVRDFHEGVAYTGGFKGKPTLENDFEVLVTFRHSRRLVPVAVSDGNGGWARKLRVRGRDSFTSALQNKSFLGPRGNLSGAKLEDWFRRSVLPTLKIIVPPEGVEIDGVVKNGVLIVKLILPEAARAFEFKIRPAFAFKSVTRMPGAAVAPEALNRKGGESKWYAVPELNNEGLQSNLDDARPVQMTRWTFVAPEAERSILRNTKYCKPLMRMMQALNREHGWGLRDETIKNLFLDAALLHQNFDFWDAADVGSAFMAMLNRLIACLKADNFPALSGPGKSDFTDDAARLKTIQAVETLRKLLLKDYRRCVRLYRSNYSTKYRKLTDEGAAMEAEIKQEALNRLFVERRVLANSEENLPTSKLASAQSESIKEKALQSPIAGLGGMTPPRRGSDRKSAIRVRTSAKAIKRRSDFVEIDDCLVPIEKIHLSSPGYKPKKIGIVKATVAAARGRSRIPVRSPFVRSSSGGGFAPDEEKKLQAQQKSQKNGLVKGETKIPKLGLKGAVGYVRKDPVAEMKKEVVLKSALRQVDERKEPLKSALKKPTGEEKQVTLKSALKKVSEATAMRKELKSVLKKPGGTEGLKPVKPAVTIHVTNKPPSRAFMQREHPKPAEEGTTAAEKVTKLMGKKPDTKLGSKKDDDDLKQPKPAPVTKLMGEPDTKLASKKDDDELKQPKTAPVTKLMGEPDTKLGSKKDDDELKQPKPAAGPGLD